MASFVSYLKSFVYTNGTISIVVSNILENPNRIVGSSGYFGMLPTDIIRHILGLLSLRDLCTLAIVFTFLLKI